MIDSVLSVITEKLNEYLGGYYDLPETLAVLGTPGDEEAEDSTNCLMVSLLNVEREGAAGFGAAYNGSGTGNVARGLPPWHVNICFVVSAVFDGKRYPDGLKMLSLAMLFLQGQGVVSLPGGHKYTIELLSLGIQELTNVWSILGGRYYPSVVCKVRMLTFDSGGIGSVSPRVHKTQ